VQGTKKSGESACACTFHKYAESKMPRTEIIKKAVLSLFSLNTLIIVEIIKAYKLYTIGV
jgi:hypothetical protein